MEINNSNRIRKIQEHPLFQELYQKLQFEERDRIFCNHTMEHFLDVARLMYIYCLEDKAAIEKDLIYAAALLHDLGRYEQLVNGTPHQIASARIAGNILKDCCFTTNEIHSVQKAISAHRDQNSYLNMDKLTSYLYRADKVSRNCFSCLVKSKCHWPDEKKNLWITY